MYFEIYGTHMYICGLYPLKQNKCHQEVRFFEACMHANHISLIHTNQCYGQVQGPQKNLSVLNVSLSSSSIFNILYTHVKDGIFSLENVANRNANKINDRCLKVC